MKIHLLVIIFTFCCISSLSQPTQKDTLNEIQELQLLKNQMTEKVIYFNKSINEKQQLLDSLRSKSDTLKITITKLQSSASIKDKKYLDQTNKTIKQLDEIIENEFKSQTSDKELLNKANNLLKEIDSRLSQLTSKST